MSNRTVFRAGLLITSVGAVLIYASSLMSQPELTFVLEKRVSTELPPQVIDRSMQILANWPKWFRNVAEAQSQDLRGVAYPPIEQVLEPGSIILLTMKSPSDNPAKLKLGVGKYLANFVLQLRLIEDSSGALTQQFDQVEWEIDFPDPKTIHIKLTARPSTFRAKLLCAIAKPLVLSNLMLPEIENLARFTQPQALELKPAFQR